MPKVSIIIPVFNTGKFLPRCLESVCNQTLKDVEIVCINDGSVDPSLEILKYFSSKDSRIKIIDLPENKGAAYARNRGIEAAAGEYLGFVDSDDFVDLDFYEKLYNKAIKTGADIAKGVYFYYKENLIGDSINKKIEENKTNFVCEYCSAIIKHDLIKTNNILFPALCDMEDPVFAFSCAIKANKIVICNDAHINIVKHANSQTARPLTLERLKDKIKGVTKIIELANNNNLLPESYGYICALWFNGLFYNIEALTLSDKIFLKNSLKTLFEIITNKNEFLKEIRKHSEIIYEILQTSKYDDFVFIDKINKINSLEEKLCQERASVRVFKNQRKTYIDKFIKPYLANSSGEDVYFISVVNDYDLYKKCISENPFVTTPQNIKLVDFDNTKENITIPKRYNNFLNNYDYSKEAWFVFCHCDWELMDDINAVLNKLNKNCLYGPIGAKLFIFGDRFFRPFIGHCLECRRDGSGIYKSGELENSIQEVDAFDCQCLIIHSSLIKQFNLRFDENLTWHLYVEDFCIQASKHNIKSYAITLDCCHWSGYHSVPDAYYKSLEYVNSKYPNDSYAGTCTIIGGKEFNYKTATPKDYMLYKMQQNIRKTMAIR